MNRRDFLSSLMLLAAGGSCKIDEVGATPEVFDKDLIMPLIHWCNLTLNAIRRDRNVNPGLFVRVPRRLIKMAGEMKGGHATNIYHEDVVRAAIYVQQQVTAAGIKSYFTLSKDDLRVIGSYLSPRPDFKVLSGNSAWCDELYYRGARDRADELSGHNRG